MRCWPPPSSSCCGSGRQRRAGAATLRPLGRCLRSRGAWRAGALAAVSLIPFGELLWLSADLHDRGGQSIDVHLELKEAIGIFMPDYWGRPTQTPFRRSCSSARSTSARSPLMLAAGALVAAANAPSASRSPLFGGLVLPWCSGSRRSSRSSPACRSSAPATTRA